MSFSQTWIYHFECPLFRDIMRFIRSEPLRVVCNVNNVLGPECIPLRIMIAMLIAYCLSNKFVSSSERVNHIAAIKYNCTVPKTNIQHHNHHVMKYGGSDTITSVTRQSSDSNIFGDVIAIMGHSP